MSGDFPPVASQVGCVCNTQEPHLVHLIKRYHWLAVSHVPASDPLCHAQPIRQYVLAIPATARRAKVPHLSSYIEWTRSVLIERVRVDRPGRAIYYCKEATRSTCGTDSIKVTRLTTQLHHRPGTGPEVQSHADTRPVCTQLWLGRCLVWRGTPR